MTIDATYRVVTPLFSAGADPLDPELRAPGVKGVLRYWWRALAWSRCGGDLDAVRRQEDRLFGSAAGGRSRVSMHLISSTLDEKKAGVGQVLDVPETKRVVGEGARYLGYGVMEAFASRKKNTKEGQLTRACLRAPFDFVVRMRGRDLTEADVASLRNALIALGTLGGLGARSRKGYGSTVLQSIRVDGVDRWDAPQSVGALRAVIAGLPCGDDKGALPEFTALSSRTRHVLVSSRKKEPLDLLEEISGHVRGQRGGARRQDDFWDGMRERLGALEIRENERLCAIALVKRVFPKVADKALGWPVDGARWPSTVYVGAVPWIRDVAAIAPMQAREYAEAVRRSTSPGVLAERRTPFRNLQDPAAGDFPALDANFFHRASLKDKRLCPLAGGAPGDARTDLDRALKQVYCAKDATGRSPGPPPAFYALLLADGDRLGKLVGRLGGEPVGRALADFTRAVPDVVRDHDGVAVYAGGDDVLAMLSAPRAIACASSLSDCYRAAFAGQRKESGATLSAAVVFAPVRHPLGAVIAEARRLLDDVAKDANGRDSLAAAVLKNSGTHCRWVTTWTRRGPDGESRPAADLLDGLAGPPGGDAAGPVLSSGLLYRIREMLTRLGGWSRWRPGMWGPLPPECGARTFLKAEILHSLTTRAVERAEARADELTDLVWAALAPSRAPAVRTEAGGAEDGVDALLLARFLADPDREEDDE